MVCGLVWLQEQTPKRHDFQKDWTTCLKYANHSRLYSPHNIGGPIRPFHELKKTFTLIQNKRFMRAPEMIRKVVAASIWICSPPCNWSHVSYPRKSGLVGEVIIQYSSTMSTFHGQDIQDATYSIRKSSWISERFSEIQETHIAQVSCTLVHCAGLHPMGTWFFKTNRSSTNLWDLRTL